MRKLFYLPILMLLLFTGCGEEKPMKTYEYEEEEVLSFSAEQMLVYEDRVEIYFSRRALSDAETVECYDADFNKWDEEIDFDADDDVLIIYTDKPQDISGLRITIEDWEYWDIRYLNSDHPAILQYTWADDWGYFCNGDEDAYYTREEKDAQARRIQENLERRDAAMAKIAGTWENEDGSLRMKIYSDYFSIIEVYELSGDAWTMTQQINGDWAGEYNSNDPNVTILYIEVGSHYSYRYDFTLYNNLTECECEFAEGRMKKVEE